MYDLSRFTLKDMIECDLKIRAMGKDSSSMEEAANKIINYLYENLIDDRTKQPANVLIRFFKIHPFGNLTAHLQQYVREKYPDYSIHDHLKCLTLLATVGQNQQWNNPLNSQNFQAIPLTNIKEVNKIKMMSQLIYQLGLDISVIIEPKPEVLIELEPKKSNVFYIADAVGSEFIPAQKSFVIPYKIKSVLGFGGLIPGGDFFSIIMFSQTKISQSIAEMFSTLALSVKSAILPFISSQRIFQQSAHEQSFFEQTPKDREKEELRSQINILNQLLEVSQTTALKQYERWRKNIKELEIAQKKLLLSKQIAEKKQQEAEKANQAKSEFLSMMSHEIRTPMNGIIGMISLLEETELNTTQKNFLDTIHTSADTLLTIINDILDLAKIESGKLTLEQDYFNISDLIKNILSLFQFQTQKKNILLKCILEDSVPECVRGDVVRIRQILINLIGNAIKFTHQGEVTIKVSSQKKDGEQADENQYMIIFAIEDTGIGISPENLNLLFQPFSQIDTSNSRNYGGTGLGLNISKRLAQMMAGNIWCKSEVNVGSTFFFTFPINIVSTSMVKSANKGSESSSSPITNNDQNNHHSPDSPLAIQILLAEDNLINQKVALLSLQKLGYQADIARNGMEVIESVQHQSYDLIFMDVQMPEMDGLQATQWIRKNLPTQPYIVALTANAMESDRQYCLDAGMNDYLAKPINLNALKQFFHKIKPLFSQ